MKLKYCLPLLHPRSIVSGIRHGAIVRYDSMNSRTALSALALAWLRGS